jgi:hypothetical protein
MGGAVAVDVDETDDVEGTAWCFCPNAVDMMDDVERLST